MAIQKKNLREKVILYAHFKKRLFILNSSESYHANLNLAHR
jgi:hypothetical protein